MNRRLAGFYIAIAVIGIISAVPFLGNLINFGNVLTFILLGFSIYVLVKQPKEIKKTAPVLMIIACGLVLVGWVIFILSGAAAAGTSAESISDFSSDPALGTFLGGALLSIAFFFSAWVLKIIAIIFSFIAAKQLRELDEKE